MNTPVTGAVNRAMNQRLGPDHRRPVIEVEDPTGDTRDIREKDWRLEDIGFLIQTMMRQAPCYNESPPTTGTFMLSLIG